MRIEEIDVTPRPRSLEAVAQEKWTPAGAVSELVDNALGVGRGNATEVRHIWNPATRELVLLDNGIGMSDLGDMAQLGKGVNIVAGDIGKYGYGGTKAIMWLPSVVEVYTIHKGREGHFRIDWDEYIARAEKSFDRNGGYPPVKAVWDAGSARYQPLRDIGGGVAIVMKLRPGRAIITTNVKRELTRTYTPGLLAGKRIVWTTVGKNGETVFLKPEQSRLTNEIEFTGAVEVVRGGNAINLPYSAKFGNDPKISVDRARASIGFGHRVIYETTECYSSPDRKVRYTVPDVCGLVILGDGWQGFLSTAKDDINDDEVKRTLMGQVFYKIEALLKASQTARDSLQLDAACLQVQDLFRGAFVKQSQPGVSDPDGDLTVMDGGGEGEGPGPGPAPGPIPTPKKGKHVADGSERVGKLGSSVIQIAHLDDAGMGGRLATVELEDGSIVAYLNKDQQTIKIAMVKKPVNEFLLAAHITHALAEALILRRDDLALTEKLFGKSIKKIIEEQQNDNYKIGRLARVITDRLHISKGDIVSEVDADTAITV